MTTTPPPPLPAARPTPGLGRAFGGIWRMTWRRFASRGQLLSHGAVTAFIVLLAYTSSRHGEAGMFIDWVSEFYLTFLLPLVVFVEAGGALRDDLKSTSVDYVFTRPIHRSAFVAFRYICHVACVQVLYLATLLIVLFVGAQRTSSEVFDVLPGLLVAQVLTIFAASALGFVLAAVTNRYVIWGITYFALIEVGLGRIPTQLSHLSMLRRLESMLEQVTAPDAGLAGQGSLIATTAAVLIAFSAIAVTAAAVRMRFREFTGAAARES